MTMCARPIDGGIGEEIRTGRGRGSGIGIDCIGDCIGDDMRY